MPMLIRRCRCGHQFEILELDGERLSQDRTGPGEDPYDLSCVKCGGTELTAIIGRPMESSRKYPYFDHGLGCTITSYRHWRQVCTRLGVTPTEGETIGTWDDIADKDESVAKRDEEKFMAYEREQREGPNREVYAKLQEQLEREQAEFTRQLAADRARQMAEYEAEVEELRQRAARR